MSARAKRGGVIRAAALILAFWSSAALAGGALDGRVYTGLIGPVEAPDLEDSLHFDNGFFWSDICTRCGFRPGPYTTEVTEAGVVFRGVLASDSRGRFDYEGLARQDGTMEVTIRWERKRWYWTSEREIAFRGTVAKESEPLNLEDIRKQLSAMDPDGNPLCARF